MKFRIEMQAKHIPSKLSPLMVLEDVNLSTSSGKGDWPPANRLGEKVTKNGDFQSKSKAKQKSSRLSPIHVLEDVTTSLPYQPRA